MDMLTVAMNKNFACDTLQRLKPSTQFDVDPVRYIVCCEDNDMNYSNVTVADGFCGQVNQDLHPKSLIFMMLENIFT
eukprot:14472434-Ditylum_brightwellii.AAC.1